MWLMYSMVGDLEPISTELTARGFMVSISFKFALLQVELYLKRFKFH
jgi:hypothetical protein